jgi:hypothetical protein
MGGSNHAHFFSGPSRCLVSIGKRPRDRGTTSVGNKETGCPFYHPRKKLKSFTNRFDRIAAACFGGCDIPAYLLERISPADSLTSLEATTKPRPSKRTHDASLDEHAEQPAREAKRSRVAQSSVNTEGNYGLNHPKPRARQSLGTHHTNTRLPAGKVDRRYQDMIQSTSDKRTSTTSSEWPEIIDLT